MTSLTNQEESSSSSGKKPSSSTSGGGDKKAVSFFAAAGGSSSRATTGASSSRAQTRTQKSPNPKRNPVPNPNVNIKKENIAQLIHKKKECEKKAHDIVLRLIEPGVVKEYVLENAIRISKQHMEDVIEERKLSRLCGWVLCDNQVDPSNVPKQTYSIRGHKVFDITERKSFCSGKCYAKATHLKEQLLTSPLWLRGLEDDEDTEFEILEDESTPDLQGVTLSFSSVTLSDDEEDNDDNKNES